MKNTEIEILLVEDNIHDAEMTMRALSENRITNNIIHLHDGVMALDFLFGNGIYEGRDVLARPKLILLDLKMPKLDGIDVLKKIKQHELTQQIPVVMLTSSKEHPDVEQCYKLGVNSYIVKPVDFDSFTKAIAGVGLYWLLHNHPPLHNR